MTWLISRPESKVNDSFLDSLPLPLGPMPPRQQMISEMVDHLRDVEHVPDIEIRLSSRMHIRFPR